MRTLTAVFLSWLHQLALCVWLGGILTIGIVTAPAVFGSAKKAGDTHLGTPLYDFAALAMGEAFRRFNYVVLVAGALMLLSGWTYATLAGLCRRRTAVRAALTALAWGIGLYLTYSLFPEMTAARASGQTEVFDGLHHAYTHASQAQLLLLLTVLALTGWMHLDRTAVSAPAAASTAARGEPSALGTA